MAPNNRWNVLGESTLYVAGDRGVAMAEFARHVARDRPSSVVVGALRRQLYRLRLRLDSVLDLCHPGAWEALGLDHAPQCFLDKSVARATGQYLRVTTAVQAIRVPSMAHLDDTSRWALVVFLEKLPSDPRSFVVECEPDDLFSIHG